MYLINDKGPVLPTTGYLYSSQRTRGYLVLGAAKCEFRQHRDTEDHKAAQRELEICANKIARATFEQKPLLPPAKHAFTERSLNQASSLVSRTMFEMEAASSPRRETIRDTVELKGIRNYVLVGVHQVFSMPAPILGK